MFVTRLITIAIIYVCRNCHTVLFFYERPSHDFNTIPSPIDLKIRYQITRCPKCGREIGSVKIDPLHNITILRRGEALKIYKSYVSDTSLSILDNRISSVAKETTIDKSMGR